MNKIDELKEQEKALTKKIETKVTQPEVIEEPIVKEQAEDKQPGLKVDNVKQETPVIEKTDYQSKFDELVKAHTKQTQAYSTLKGKYNAEVPRSAKELAEAKARLQVLEAKITQLEAKDEYDLNDFDTNENQDVVSRQSNVEFDSFRDELNAIKDAQKDMKVENFYNQLTSTVPDWAVINSDPKWHEWLSNSDPFYQQTYQEMLDVAQKGYNSDGVSKIFNMFKGKDTVNVPQPVTKRNIEDIIAPARGNGSGSEIKTPVVYSATQIENMKDRVLKLRRQNTAESNAKSNKLLGEIEKYFVDLIN